LTFIMPFKPFPQKLAAAIALLLPMPALLAQSAAVPDAGALRQQIEQPGQLALPPALRSERPLPIPPEIKPRPGLTVQVKQFRFVGNSLLTAEQLAPALVGFLNRSLSFEELQRAADAVAASYREAGWIVRVFLPEQDISTGVVTLQVVEARFGGVRFEGTPPQRVMSSELEAYFNAHQAQGLPLNAMALDRALLLADDLPGVSVAGTLVPGMADGETLLALQTTDEPAVYGEIGLDNTGARATGSERLSADLNFNSPGRRGELINMSLLHSRGSDYGRFRLAVPEGHQGLRLGVSASYMDYKVVDGPSANSAAPITGRSSSFGLDWSYPLVRARLQNVYGTGALENKKFFTRDTQVRSDYATDSLRLGLSGNRFDNFGGGGANSASVQLLWGNLTDMQAHTQIDTLARSYRKAAYGVSRQQNLMPQHSLYVSFSGQDAPQVLDSSERFYIGGASSVRAYPSSEHGGDRGQVLNAEWRWRVSPNFLLTAFVDAGRVVQLAQPSMPETTLRLRGRGLSLAWQGPKGLTTQLTWAHRNGQNPLPTLTGTDGDGTLKRDRFWFSATVPF
jgi:hemolysin activation/secretion protein